MRLLKMTAIGLFAVCMNLIGTTAPAQAATAPSCVRLYQWDSGGRSYASAQNWGCGSTVRVRMIWAWASDGACVTLRNNEGYSEWKWGWPPYVGELRTC